MPTECRLVLHFVRRDSQEERNTVMRKLDYLLLLLALSVPLAVAAQ